MGARGVSTSFQTVADKNDTAANWLRGLAILLLVLFAALVIWALWGGRGAS